MEPADTSLESLLRRPEEQLRDEGFSRRVMMKASPSRIDASRGRRWVLRIGAAAGIALATALAPPLEGAFGASARGGGESASFIAMLLLALIVLPTAWAFRSH